MSAQLLQVIYRVATDAEFRIAFEENPKAAIAAHELDLIDEELSLVLEAVHAYSDPAGSWTINACTLAALA